VFGKAGVQPLKTYQVFIGSETPGKGVSTNPVSKVVPVPPSRSKVSFTSFLTKAILASFATVIVLGSFVTNPTTLLS
jgi:hypothetical protein